MFMNMQQNIIVELKKANSTDPSSAFEQQNKGIMPAAPISMENSSEPKFQVIEE